MENPDVSHDVNKKDEAIQENQAKSLYNETLIDNHNEAEAFLKNLNDLNSNDLHLKRKRESEISLSIREKNPQNLKEEGKNLNSIQTCQLCQIEDPLKQIIKCKICKRPFHSDCFIKIGRISGDNQSCNQCLQREISNQFNSNNSANYNNNFNAMNPNFQVNSQNYPQNLNLLNELLKNNINRNMMMMQNTLNNPQNKINYTSGGYVNYQTGLPLNNMSNMMNISNPQTLPNNILQNGQIPISQMNPQQLMILSHMLKNEKPEVQNYLGSISEINNIQWPNNPILMNNIMMKQNTISNYAGINASNPEALRNNIYNQLMANISNSKVPTGNTSTLNPTQTIKSNINSNLVENNSNNNKFFDHSQQFQNEQHQTHNQSALLNLVSKQNNITNLNFFNNLFNISQIQNTNSNMVNPNNNYINENVLMNLIPNKIVPNTSSTINYQSTNNYNSKTQNYNSSSVNNLEFVGANSYLNNLISNGTMHSSKKDIKKFPVEDSLLLKDPEKYEIDKKCFVRPEPKNLEIPQKFQNKIFTIWDFLQTFQKVLDSENGYFSKNEISSDIEQFYINIQIQENFIKIILSILNLYLLYSYGGDPTEFEVEKGLLFLRTMKENIHTSLNIVAINTWKEIIKLITESKKFGLLLNNDMNNVSKKIKDLSLEEESNFEFSLEEKITILFYLVNSTMDINKIKDLIKSEYDKKNNLTREKLSLKIEYKNKDLRKKEIEKSNKFLKAPIIIEELNRKLQDMEQSNPVTSKNLNKQKKELEIERERYSSILKENVELQKVKENIIERRDKIKSQLQEMNINNKRLIGVDAFKSEFYFFNNVPNKIYVKRIVDSSKDNIKCINKLKEKENIRTPKETNWLYYNDKQEIQDLLNKLQEKGLKEKKLKNKLKKILTKKMKFDIFLFEPESENGKVDEVNQNKPHTESDQIIVPINDGLKDKVDGSFHETNELTLAVETIMKMDEKFSEYLTQYSKEWEDKDIRIKWREIITSNPNLDNLRNSLSMFNIRFKNPYRNDEPPLSDVEIEEKEKYRQKFQFKDKNNKILLEIKAFDNSKLLAPKVKIWSKDLETYEMEKYYNESILPFINNKSKLYVSLHFFESIIFNLIKRRETLTKKNLNLLREITEGNDIIINEIENIEFTEEKDVKEMGSNDRNLLNEQIQLANEDKTLSYSPDNEKTETILLNPSENNSEKKNKNNDEEKEDNLKNIPKIDNVHNLDNLNKIHIRKKKLSNINTGINLLKKRKRHATPKDLTMTEWRDTCYICLEYGDLVCCDGCTNAAHLFCAYLDKLPNDWYCENCSEKMKKNKKQNK